MRQTTANRRSNTPISSARRLWILGFVVACGFVGLWSDAAAAPRKVRVQDSEVARELVARGGKVVADYGSFQLLETDATNVISTARPASFSEIKSDTIEFHSKRIDTRSAEGQALRKRRSAFEGQRLHLVQFVGPIKPEWRESVEQFGIQIVSYVPQNAYLVRGDATALQKFQEWAATSDVVQWDGDYLDDFKVHPGARNQDEFGFAVTPESSVFAVQLIDDGVGNEATLALINELKLESVQRDFRVLKFRNLIVRLPPERISELAAQPDVVSIQPYLSPEKYDERQAQIVAGNVIGSSLNGPGYLDWLAQKGFTQEQFDASGFVVDVSDSGIDNGTLTPGHFALYAKGNPVGASRIAYNRLEGTGHAGGTLAGCDGHGTLNAHIVAGYSDLTGFPHTDSLGFRYGLGVCPFVRIGSSVVFDPIQFTFPNYADLQSRAYADGARISVNSWGMTNNTYTVDAQAFDALVRDAQPDGAAISTPGNQEMVIVFAAGNRGPTGNSVGSPGTAKNVITVGASENVRSLNAINGGKSSMGADGCGYSDAIADAANDLAIFSSRGPCSDGRMKPDLVAPGTHIVGGVPQAFVTSAGLGDALSCFSAAGLCALSGSGTIGSANNFFPLGQQFYTVSSGTSHAAPAVAGACALLRQYFLNQGWNAPSPAMTKAFLMNSTRFLTGAGGNDNLWSPGQGMGAVNLGRAFDEMPRILRDQVEADTFTASGQVRVFTGRIVATNEPVRVTLAWTDAPGSTTGNAFNNDLDLSVEVGGVTYLGNHFSGAYSIAGGTPDAKNNVESVLLPAGVSGDITVTILAANINSDGVPNFGGELDQDFALVIYNATNTIVSRVAVAEMKVLAEGFLPGNGVVDPGEMVKVGLALQNLGTATATNLSVVLNGGDGITPISGATSYGDLSNDAQAVSREFTFVETGGNCGDSVELKFQLSDVSGELGEITVPLTLGLKTIETHSFTNGTEILISDSGPASPYPAVINVTGLSGVVQKVTVTLHGFTHQWPDDVDVLLVGPEGQKVLLMSDCGGGNTRNGTVITFDDAATASLPDSGAIASGGYKPTNYDTSSDKFAAPAPDVLDAGSLASFIGTNPNGAWSLYIQDDGAMDSGSVTHGWSLSITTSNLVCASDSEKFADIAVGLVVETNQVFTGSNFSLTITVTNAGSNPAAFVVVSNSLPAAFVLSEFQSTHGTAEQQGASLVWSIDALAVGTAAELVIEGKILLPGNFDFIVTATSFTADEETTNNIATQSISAFKFFGPNIVISTNTPPVLTPIVNRMVHAGSVIQFTNTATDAESPGNLTFSLLSGAPLGATLNTTNGIFSWATTDADAGSMNEISLQVADDAMPPLTDVKTFSIFVADRPTIMDLTITGGVASVTWSSLTGQWYQLQTTTNFLEAQWNPVLPNILATGPTATQTNAVDSALRQFYRVLVLP